MMLAGHATDFGTLAHGRNLILPGAFAKLIANSWQRRFTMPQAGIGNQA
ncbi:MULTISPECIES: hypothetical protein [unclassified Mesorhizobium]